LQGLDDCNTRKAYRVCNDCFGVDSLEDSTNIYSSKAAESL